MDRKSSPSACSAFVFLLLCGVSAFAQQPQDEVKPAPPPPDVLVFKNGEKLIGKLIRSTGASVTFHSEMAGDITVDWSKIAELKSSGVYAVLEKDVRLTKHESGDFVPQGRIDMENQELNIVPDSARPRRSIPVAQSAYVIDQKTFQNVILNQPGFFQKWTGSITAGATLIQATQSGRTFNGGLNLVRALPAESWLDRRNRTVLNFSGSYGFLRQPGVADVKTEIYHLDSERDEYFSPRLYGFGQLAYDHNFSQGLDLQQSYGGGIGWTVIRRDNTQFDLKGSIGYLDQKFQDSTQNQKLVGSTFTQAFNHKFRNGMTFNQQLAVTPAWNNTEAYSANGSATFAMPVYKRLSLSIGTLDTFLNNPPQGFKKNSFQFNTGLTYALP